MRQKATPKVQPKIMMNVNVTAEGSRVWALAG